MFIGLDVGGTHTDVVVMDHHTILASTKVATDHNQLLHSIQRGLAEVLNEVRKEAITRVHLSTTLSTNAIVENTLEPVGVLVSAGPGIHPAHYAIGDHYHLIDGFIDHRGTEIRPLQTDQLSRAATACEAAGVTFYAAVSKFSPRNPIHENAMQARLQKQAEHITVGHQLSGQLNFPRRIATAYYNAAVWPVYNTFVDAVERSMQDLGLRADLQVLKANGGTMPVAISRQLPVESILSGPAASIMGSIALCDITEDSIILDIGGTTTDIAIFAGGAPLLEPAGISLNGHHTLVHALQTRSIGIGGDSAIHITDGAVTAGPTRFGPAMANGGSYPTLSDACNVAKISNIGDVHASAAGLCELAEPSALSPDQVAEQAIRYAAERIQREVDALLDDINAKPVYTIHELLEGRTVQPTMLYLLGGPARALSGVLSTAFGVQVIVPSHYAVANAIGAALTRNTVELDLFADTEKQIMMIPTFNVSEHISRRYSLTQAKEDAIRYMRGYLTQIGVPDHERFIEITEAETFNMVSGFSTTGRNIRVKCQIKPGIRAHS